MRSDSTSAIRLQILTVVIAAGILMTWAQSESLLHGEPSSGGQIGMALAGIGACLAIGVQAARRRNEP